MKIEKKCPDFGKKNSLNIEFVIWNTIFRISRRKNSEIVPCGVFLLCVLDEMFIDIRFAFFSKNLPCPEKFLIASLICIYILYIYIYICIHLYLSIYIIYIYNVFIIYIYIYILHIIYIYALYIIYIIYIKYVHIHIYLNISHILAMIWSWWDFYEIFTFFWDK